MMITSVRDSLPVGIDKPEARKACADAALSPGFFPITWPTPTNPLWRGYFKNNNNNKTAAARTSTTSTLVNADGAAPRGVGDEVRRPLPPNLHKAFNAERNNPTHLPRAKRTNSDPSLDRPIPSRTRLKANEHHSMMATRANPTRFACRGFKYKQGKLNKLASVHAMDAKGAKSKGRLTRRSLKLKPRGTKSANPKRPPERGGNSIPNSQLEQSNNSDQAWSRPLCSSHGHGEPNWSEMALESSSTDSQQWNPGDNKFSISNNNCAQQEQSEQNTLETPQSHIDYYEGEIKVLTALRDVRRAVLDGWQQSPPIRQTWRMSPITGMYANYRRERFTRLKQAEQREAVHGRESTENQSEESCLLDNTLAGVGGPPTAFDPSNTSGMPSSASTARARMFMMRDEQSLADDFRGSVGNAPSIPEVAHYSGRLEHQRSKEAIASDTLQGEEHGPSSSSRGNHGPSPTPSGRELVGHLARRGLETILNDDNSFQAVNDYLNQGSGLSPRRPNATQIATGSTYHQQSGKTCIVTQNFH